MQTKKCLFRLPFFFNKYVYCKSLMKEFKIRTDWNTFHAEEIFYTCLWLCPKTAFIHNSLILVSVQNLFLFAFNSQPFWFIRTHLVFNECKLRCQNVSLSSVLYSTLPFLRKVSFNSIIKLSSSTNLWNYIGN